MQKWVSKTELATIAGVSKAAITKASLVAFPNAVEGNRVDLDHVETQIYLQRRGIEPTDVVIPTRKPASEPPAPRPPSTPPAPPEPTATDRYREDRAALAAARTRVEAGGGAERVEVVDEDELDVATYGHWTLDDLLRRFHTAKRFVLWLDARKRMSDIVEKDLKNAERLGRLIPREFVQTHLLSHVEGLSLRLLTDFATTAARRIYALAKADVPVEEAEKQLRALVTEVLQPAKDQIAKTLRDTERDA